MAKLNPDQIRILNEKCNSMPIAQLKKYVVSGQIDFPDDLPALETGRRAELENMLATMPNPVEAAEWQKILAQASYSPDDKAAMMNLLSDLEQYIDRWDRSRPVDNHVDDAIGVREEVKDALSRASLQEEEADWNNLWNVQGGSTQSLLGHMAKYPMSAHLDEIDDAVWMNLTMEGDLITAADTYDRYFPRGRHKAETDRIRRSRQEWEDCKNYFDLQRTADYIRNYPDSPFINEARNFLQRLKGDELAYMRERGSTYDANRILQFVEDGVFTEQELIMARIIEPGDIQQIRNAADVRATLPDILSEINNCKKEVAEDATDVFFFGVPSTGKSCILMGLTQSGLIHCNWVKGAGAYAAALNQYLEAGITIDRTPGDFIATIHASIEDDEKSHPLNLVEMSGEEFAFKLANNENGVVSFEDMGSGASQLLSNSNRKIFFIIIDPTTTTLNFPHSVQQRDMFGNPMYNEEGNPVMTTRTFNLNQRVTLRKMLDVMTDESNDAIMKNVDAIHFIVTKADMLDHNNMGNDRESEALNRFQANFGSEVNRLIKYCKANGINSTNNKATDGHPNLYTFSLGKFKIGGFFDFDPMDADKLVDVIRSNTFAKRDEGFMDRLRGMFNRKLF